MKEPTYFINNRFVLKSKATISVWDIGFIRSYGVVEFLITYNGIPFKLSSHLERLYNSAKTINLKINLSKIRLKNIILKTLKKNNFPEANIWIIVTGGVGPSTKVPAKKPSVIVLVDPFIPYPKKCYEKGVSIITYKAKRVLIEVKSMIYTMAIMGLKQAYKKNAVEALYFHNGQVTECMTSNFFIIKNNQIYTAMDKDILLGITRQVIFDICKNKLKINKTKLTLKQVLEADEVFLTASSKEVMPVVKIDDNIIGNGKVGSQTKKIMYWFTQYTKKQV